jgi:hypothetical protein
VVVEAFRIVVIVELAVSMDELFELLVLLHAGRTIDASQIPVVAVTRKGESLNFIYDDFKVYIH